jgi:hypothetical protein
MADSQSLFVVHQNAEVANCECLRAGDGFKKLVDGVHEAGDLHLVGKPVHLHGKLSILERFLVTIEEPRGQQKLFLRYIC